MAILKVPYNGEWAIIESPSAVRFTEQDLTESEKARARANIGAVAADEVSIKVDTALSKTSSNPVQNKVIAAEVEKLATKEYVDNAIESAGSAFTYEVVLF